MKLSIALAGLGLALAAGVASAEEPQVKTERHVMVIGGPGAPGKMDKNGDGEVTREEFMAPHAEVFAKLDANGDGKISKAELEKGGMWESAEGDHVFVHGPMGPHGPMGGPGDKRVQVFEMRHGGEGGPDGMDADKDGKLSAEEFVAPMMKAFEQMDADKSGFVEEGERARGPMRMKFEKRIETKEDKKAG